MTDLEVFEKTLKLYKEQENPVDGWWWHRSNEGILEDSLCLEGCLLKALGFEDERAIEKEYLNDPGDATPIQDAYKASSAYKKLMQLCGRNCFLYLENDNAKNVKRLLKKAIEQERKSENE